MRRIILVLIVAAVVVVGGVLLFRKPKPAARSSRSTTQSDSISGAGRRSTAAQGRTAGRIRAKTKEERAAERKRLRAEERKRKKELKRQERERRRMLKYARSRRGGRKTASRKGTYYVVKAIVSLGEDSYALIDNRRVRVGDVVMGRKIVAIGTDRIEVEAFGRRTTVRVGESLLPPSYFTQRKRS
ncbi:MAG: hypothetical protein ABIK11_01445 [candidate division WOR-3 bacterium]